MLKFDLLILIRTLLLINAITIIIIIIINAITHTIIITTINCDKKVEKKSGKKFRKLKIITI